MEFKIISHGEYIEMDTLNLIKRYDLSGVYPKIIVASQHTYYVWLSESAYLDELFKTYEDAESTCNYIRGLYYNIMGTWKAGG